MPSRRFAPAFPALLCAMLLPAVQAQARVTVMITEWGETAGTQGEPSPPIPPDTGLAPSHPMTGVTFLSHSDVIVGRLCGSFGVTAKVDADPGDVAPERLSILLNHPLMTRPDGVTSTVDRFHTSVNNGITHAGFVFDNPWEVQPGQWTISFALDGKVVSSKAFTVVLPPPGKPQTACPATSVS